MTQFNYNPDLSSVRVVDTELEQQKFFVDGHPNFFIPDFSICPTDIWLSYMDFLEGQYLSGFDTSIGGVSTGEIYDQDGGEITSHHIIDRNTGLTKCVYEAYGIMMDENDEPQDVEVEIEGYVVEKDGEYLFYATKVFENYKLTI